MDENDVYAILTRRLIENFSPFSTTSNKALENENIKIYGDKHESGDQEFTTLTTLYNMNKILLEINQTSDLNPQDIEDKDKRPDDFDLDFFLNVLKEIWRGIFEVFPEFNGDRTIMRSHNDLNQEDHIFLWPKMQTEVLARLVRALINKGGTENNLTFAQILAPLAKLELDARKAPYRKLWIIPSDLTVPDENLKISDATARDKIPKKVLEILRYQLGLDELNNDKVEKLKQTAGQFGQEGGLISNILIDEWWEEVEAIKAQIDS
tara:strand:- start:118 stop:912 length:795 start_codon:yes stop_codon:yes gene_type:complete